MTPWWSWVAPILAVVSAVAFAWIGWRMAIFEAQKKAITAKDDAIAGMEQRFSEYEFERQNERKEFADEIARLNKRIDELEGYNRGYEDALVLVVRAAAQAGLCDKDCDQRSLDSIVAPAKKVTRPGKGV
jgi:hypothetical protein